MWCLGAFYFTINMIVYKVILYALDDESIDVKMLRRVVCQLYEHCTDFRVHLEQAQCMKQFHLPPCVRIFPFEIQSYIC